MKRFFIIVGLGFLLTTTSAIAAIEERSYSLTFVNAPTAGTAFNVRFAIPLPEGVTVVNMPNNAAIVDGVLYLIGPTEILPSDSWVANITLSGPTEILDTLDNKEIAYDWQDDYFIGEAQVLSVRAEAPTADAADIINRLRSDPRVTEPLGKIGVPLAVGLGAVGAVSLTITAVSASASLAFNIAEFLRYLAFGFLRFKKRKPWGAVYNQIVNVPVAGALVKIFDASSQKLKESQITDAEGRFGFLVQPGDYYVKAERRGFADNQSDTLKVQESEMMTNINLPLVPTTAGVKVHFRILSAVRGFIEVLNPYILALGTILSLAIAIIIPTKLNMIVLTIYVLVDALKIILAWQTIKPFGVVKDKANDKTLDLAVVRIFDAQKNWLLNTKVTDLGGRFSFLVTPGSYYMIAFRDGYQPFYSPIINVRKSGLINLDIRLAGVK